MRDLKRKSKRGTDKTCAAETHRKSSRLKLISVYLSTGKISKEFHGELLYEIIANIISQTPKRDALRYAGDFSANTGSGLENVSSNFQRCSVKKVFLKISQNSQENICARAFFLIKLQT